MDGGQSRRESHCGQSLSSGQERDHAHFPSCTCRLPGRGQGAGGRAQGCAPSQGLRQEESPCAPSLASCGFWEEQAVPAQACGLGKRSMWDTVFPDKMRQSLSQLHCSAREHLCNPRPAPHEPLALAPPATQLPPLTIHQQHPALYRPVIPCPAVLALAAWHPQAPPP